MPNEYMSGSVEKRMVLLLERLVDHSLLGSSAFATVSDINACSVSQIIIANSDDFKKARSEGLFIEWSGRLELINVPGGGVRYRYYGYESANLDDGEKKVRIPEQTVFVVWYWKQTDPKKIFALDGAGLFIRFVTKI